MSTTAPTQRRQVDDDATRAADLLATVADWHLRHTSPITPAGMAALTQDASTDIPREPSRRTTEKDAA